LTQDNMLKETAGYGYYKTIEEALGVINDNLEV
jgi:hypothetical protein